MRPLSEFDPAWPHGHAQESGKQVRILGEVRADDYPLIVAVPSDCGTREIVVHYTADGRLWNNGRTSPHDLINASAPSKRVQGWVNVYPGGIPSGLYPDKALADDWASSNRVACVFIDVEEGEGLS